MTGSGLARASSSIMAIMRVAELRTSAYAQSFRPGSDGSLYPHAVETEGATWRFASVGLSRELDAKALLLARLLTERLDRHGDDGTADAI